jgi:hypothetical protein
MLTRPLPNLRSRLRGCSPAAATLLLAILFLFGQPPSEVRAEMERIAAAHPLGSVGMLSPVLGNGLGEGLPPLQTDQDLEDGKAAAIQTMLLQRAEELLREGDISSARMILEHLLRRAELAEVYWALGRTYDPVVLRTLHVVGTLADAGKARELYDLARRFGSEELNPAPSCKRRTCLLLDEKPGRQLLSLR